MNTRVARARATRPLPSWKGWIWVNRWCSQAAATEAGTFGCR